MYKIDRYHQFNLLDFSQLAGLKMDPENRWGRKAAIIPWEAIEEKYAKLILIDTGIPAKSLRTVLGFPMIPKQYGYSDMELSEQIKENLYYQYFVGPLGYQPFVLSPLEEFRKHFNNEVIMENNEMIIAYNAADNSGPGDGGGKNSDVVADKPENSVTIILDATCVPQNISFPQDINPLNAEENRKRWLTESVTSTITTGAVEFHRNIHSGDGHCPHRGMFLAPIYNNAVFKVESAGFSAFIIQNPRRKCRWLDEQTLNKMI